MPNGSMAIEGFPIYLPSGCTKIEDAVGRTIARYGGSVPQSILYNGYFTQERVDEDNPSPKIFQRIGDIVEATRHRIAYIQGMTMTVEKIPDAEV